MKTKFIAIAALGLSRQIGLNGGLPWSIPEEYEHFKKTVKGHHVLIGRKNFEIHKEDIEGCTPLVLSKSDPRYFKDMNQVIEHAEANQIETIYVVGGAEIYELTLPYISEFYCSVVDYDGPADKFFPEYMFYEWEIQNQEIHEKWTLYHMKKRPDF
jgi:dihydrofolate reductase